MIKVGEVRKWKDGTGSEQFKVEKYKSFFVGEHYYTIKYLTDGREQTVSENALLMETELVFDY